jgi:hypothetical protein
MSSCRAINQGRRTRRPPRFHGLVAHEPLPLPRTRPPRALAERPFDVEDKPPERGRVKSVRLGSHTPGSMGETQPGERSSLSRTSSDCATATRSSTPPRSSISTCGRPTSSTSRPPRSAAGRRSSAAATASPRPLAANRRLRGLPRRAGEVLRPGRPSARLRPATRSSQGKRRAHYAHRNEALEAVGLPSRER